MEIQYTQFEDQSFAELTSDGLVIGDAQDALDLLANCAYNGATKIIVREEHLSPSFFDLRSGLAGEVLQKFSNYRCQLAIVGDFGRYESKSLRDFIYESNKGGRICFVGSVEEAKDKLVAGR